MATAKGSTDNPAGIYAQRKAVWEIITDYRRIRLLGNMAALAC